MKDMLLIIGAGGHGKVLADIAAKMNKWKEIAFLDDHPTSDSCLGFPILGTIEQINNYRLNADIIIGIGYNDRRQEIQEDLTIKGFSIATLIHPSATIALDVTIGEGSVIMAGAVINPSSRIGRGCIFNTSVSVDHDNQIGDYTHISPGAHLAGTVTLGVKVWIGMGAIVINNTDIVSGTIIGAGTVVIQNITVPGTYVGVPARRT